MTSILAFPVSNNPYTERFYPALQDLGIEVREGIFAGRWLLRNLRDVDYVHIHWPNFLYSRPHVLQCLRAFSLFLFLLALARLRGARIIWTIHNLHPHDPCVVRAFDNLASWLLVKFSSLFLVHGASAKAEALKLFPSIEHRTALIDHGHWIGFYPDTIERPAARRKLQIPNEAYVFLFVGLCKPYKNIDGLIKAFERVPRDPLLVIAGKFASSSYQAHIESAIERSPVKARIRVFPEYVPDAELQVFLRACDVVVIPYLEFLTSGTGLLALSFGRAIIAPARGSLRDVVTNECGLLYEPDLADGLRLSMLAAMDKQFDEQEIRKIALVHDWHRSARALLLALSSI